MYSLNLDYIFNTVYNVFLTIRYVWIFKIWRITPEAYLAKVDGREWDGLRDRGWVQSLIDKRDHAAASAKYHQGFTSYLAEKAGITLPDRDHDGIPDTYDNSPYDPENLTAVEMKERFQNYYDFGDKLRDFFGFGPADLDKDGLPDSYEKFLGTDASSPDTDSDGLFDGNEIVRNLDPKNPDTDGDTVLDGRDAFPLDSSRSADGLDTDHDGLSDAYENRIGTDPTIIDTDGDGIPDGADAYPLDAHNKSHAVSVSDYTAPLDHVQFAIQNPVLQFVRDMFSILSLIGLVFLAITFMRFLKTFWEAQMHYEHHFGHGAGHGHDAHPTHHGKPHTVDHDASHKGEPHKHNVVYEKESHGSGSTSESHAIEGLAVLEGLPFEVHTPTEAEYEKHPKWAIIEGYMSADTEALWRIGILEADMMLRDALQAKGYRGADVGELLQSANFSTIQLAWEAHKVRNRIAHEGSDYLLTEREARRVFGLFESVFKELKVI